MKLAEALARSRVLAVLRSERVDRFGEVAEVLHGAGVAAVEFTLTSAVRWRPSSGVPPARRRGSASVRGPCSAPRTPAGRSAPARSTS